MRPTVISIRGIGKRYRLGVSHGIRTYKVLRDVLVGLGRAPLRALRGIGRKAPGEDREDMWALKDISLDVQQGDVVGLIGKNGAGKSTLLKVLSQITSPTEGEIRIRGRVSSLLEVGTGFHPELTGRENVFMNGAILGMSRSEIRRKFDEIVSFAEVEKFIDTPVKRYSSGMYVRLAFAVAAYMEPEILLVDEVLAVGDAAFRKKCLERLQVVGESGITIFLVSHNMAQIRRLASKAVWLHEGRVKELGSPMDVTLNYEKETVYRSGEIGGVFVRSEPHNPRIWISRTELRNQRGECKNDFRYGDDIQLDIYLEYGEGFDSSGIRNIALNWILTDEGDVRISADSMIHHKKMLVGNEGLVRCTIRAIPLYKGTYKLMLGITHETHGRLDTWRDGISFHVVYSSPVGHGYERDRRSGFVHIDADWEVPEQRDGGGTRRLVDDRRSTTEKKSGDTCL